MLTVTLSERQGFARFSKRINSSRSRAVLARSRTQKDSSRSTWAAASRLPSPWFGDANRIICCADRDVSATRCRKFDDLGRSRSHARPLRPPCSSRTFLGCGLTCNRRTSRGDKGRRRGFSRKSSAQPGRAVAPKNGNGGRYLAGLYRTRSAAGRQWIRRDATRCTDRFQPALHGAAHFSKRL